MSLPKTSFKTTDAWLCALTLVVTQSLVLFWIRLAGRSSIAFYHWWGSTEGLAFSVILQGFLWLFWALWFSRAENLRELFSKIGLNRKINLYGYLGAWVAILIGFVDHYGISHGWVAGKNTYGISTNLIDSYYVFFIVKTIVLVPFYEEVATRGFMFTAFREKYNIAACVCLICIFSIYFHWGIIAGSFYTFLCLMSFFTLLCIVRENTDSLWNCMLCHGVYNSVGMLFWYPTIIFMFCILPFIIFSARDKNG